MPVEGVGKGIGGCSGMYQMRDVDGCCEWKGDGAGRDQAVLCFLFTWPRFLTWRCSGRTNKTVASR